jgi:hypothetical protein
LCRKFRASARAAGVFSLVDIVVECFFFVKKLGSLSLGVVKKRGEDVDRRLGMSMVHESIGSWF